MKWKIIILVLSASVLSGLSSCKQVLDINHDPNVSVDRSGHNATCYFRLPLVSAASAVGGEMAIIGCLWSEYTTQDVSSSQYRNFDSYNVTSTDLNTDYNQLYTGALNDLELILQKTQGGAGLEL